MSERVEVRFRSDTSEGGFTRYYSRDVAAFLVPDTHVWLDETPLQRGYYKIKRRVINFEDTAEEIGNITLHLTWAGLFL